MLNHNASRYGTQVTTGFGCKVPNLPGNDVSTYLDGLMARAGRAHARLKSIGVPGAYDRISRVNAKLAILDYNVDT
jgi:hypothetical protein